MEPLEAFEHAVTTSGTRRLDEPLPPLQLGQAELLGDLWCRHGLWEVLLVRVHQHARVPELVVPQERMQFVARLIYPVVVAAVHHEDDTLHPGCVVAPELSDLLLAAHVPDGHAEVLVLNCFDVEAERRDRRDDLAVLDFI
eukprot:CAMPEP_0179265904 /NCGR_PEP_ID=MMETSP0797-20121207/29142_1 /TAXON_ID=47934 /ORGANISM="Dinophysis acuminata, Strain DAEP01" /LENGTH=140 /DNA_ID=CAMNT_0020974123 /DNA_START=133 /DNA_END=555 /DNA_ORIENTATION=-